MGMLVEGKWCEDDAASALRNDKGEYIRAESRCRDWISSGEGSDFPAESGRYHLFLAHSCPWAHRTHITLKLLRLGNVVGTSFADPRRDDEGWWYKEGLDDTQLVNGKLHLHQLYTTSDAGYTGRVTTPTLWDRKTRTVINNESEEILRMLNAEFSAFSDTQLDLYPESQRADIDEVNARVYRDVNNGVYRCGFAQSQEAYEEACTALFETLDWLDLRLGRHRYLAGRQLSEADVRLFPTLVRFDPVYYGHFKCNLRRIADYANLSGYLRDLYQTPAFGETVNVPLYKQGYYGNSPSLNPRGIIPVGPELHYDTPHDRATREYGG